MAMLQPAINLGLDEERFWEMTVAEVERYTDGAIWRLKSQAQFDYTLAHLIGISVSRLMSKDAVYPHIDEVYPELFKDEKTEKQKELAESEIATQKSVNNFLAFAMANNARRKDKGSE